MEHIAARSSSGPSRTAEQTQVTWLLDAWRMGKPNSEDALLRATYPALRALSQSALSKSHCLGHSQATEIANEAYLRIREQKNFHWKNRNHFYAIAARVVRRLIIDEVRQVAAQKRGSSYEFVSVDLADEVPCAQSAHPALWIDLDHALVELEREDPRSAQLVELRFFDGLTIDEAAAVLGCSLATATRTWRFARAWLSSRLVDDSP